MMEMFPLDGVPSNREVSLRDPLRKLLPAAPPPADHSRESSWAVTCGCCCSGEASEETPALPPPFLPLMVEDPAEEARRERSSSTDLCRGNSFSPSSSQYLRSGENEMKRLVRMFVAYKQ